MLSDGTRREVIDDIVARVERTTPLAQLRATAQEGGARLYERHFSQCTVRVVTLPIAHNPVIEIATNFSDPAAISRATGFDGYRVVYRGSYDGLLDVSLEGSHLPGEDGSVLPPASAMIRSFLPPASAMARPSDSSLRLTTDDQQRFDLYLAYALRELRSV